MIFLALKPCKVALFRSYSKIIYIKTKEEGFDVAEKLLHYYNFWVDICSLIALKLK